jgi:xanthine dehydrogenase accessory factor
LSGADIIGEICRFLEAGESLVLATLVRRQGSVPRRIGTKMIISHDGRTCGTIGGGLMEDKVLREAVSIIVTGKSKFINFDFDNIDVNTRGMLCGGKATVLLEYLEPSEENISYFRSLHNVQRNRENCVLVTLYEDGDSGETHTGHCLLFPNGSVIAQCPLSAEDMETLKNNTYEEHISTTIRLKDHLALLEPAQKTKTLYCFGAGHIAVPTARIAYLVGFAVTVVDNRADLARTERFPGARVHLIDDFKYAFEGLEIDRDSYIVIVTHDHLYDKVVLENALRTEAGYIGMIASRKKRDTIFRNLLDEGWRQDDLKCVHSPIGLDIGAETPEEIAVSIVAEMIQERVGKRS